MNRRTPAEWLNLFNEQEHSGQTDKAFCQERSLDVNYFKKRRKQLLDSDVMPNTSAFIPVTVTRATGTLSIELKCNDVVLTIPLSIPPLWLAELVQHLRS